MELRERRIVWFCLLGLGSCLDVDERRVAEDSNGRGQTAQALGSVPVFQDPIAGQAVVQPKNTWLLANRFNNIRFADQFPGADACAKINAAYSDLPTNLPGQIYFTAPDTSQTCAANPFSGPARTGELFLVGTITTSAQWIIPNKFVVRGVGRGDATFTNTAIKASSTFPQNTPLIKLGPSAPVFGTRLENLTVDCGGIAGCTGVYSDAINEQSGLSRVLVTNTPGIGIDFEAGCQNYFVEDVEVSPGQGATITSTIGMKINTVNFQQINRVTVNGANGPTGQIKTGILLMSGGPLSGIHIEHAVTGIDVFSDNVVLSALSIGPYLTDGLVIEPGTQNNVFMGLQVTEPTAVATLLRDLRNGKTLTLVQEPQLAYYVQGDGLDQTIMTSAEGLSQLIHVPTTFFHPLGIGTTTPGQSLDIVAGNGRVESGHSWLTNSDAQFKTNVTTLEGALGRVLALRGVRYDLKDDKGVRPGRGKYIGVIAQELEQQFPELVHTDDRGTRSVAYDQISAVLVQALKELRSESSAEIARLAQDNRDLRARLSAIGSIETRLRALETTQARPDHRRAEPR